MDHNKLEQALRMARAYAAERLPWFAPALYACRLVISEAVPGMAAADEGMRVYFNPNQVAALLADTGMGGKTWPLPELGWVWFHEIAHIVREHGQRARDRTADANLWNIAADMEINDAQPEGLTPPQLCRPICPRDFQLPEGQLAEFYYDRLLDRAQEQAQQSALTRANCDAAQGGQPPLDGPSESPAQCEQGLDLDEGSGAHGGKCPGELPEDGHDAMQGGQHSLDRPGESPGQCQQGLDLDEGSGVHGGKCPWELPEDGRAAPALSEVERDLVRRTVADGIERCKMQGTLPAGWVRWAEETSTPRVDWREVLRRRVRGAIVTGTGQRMDYTFLRPHRRASVYAPFLPPSLYGDFLPRVTCVVDTSGSISEAKLAQALAEVRGVLEALRTPILIIPCDAIPYEPITVFTQSNLLTLCRDLAGGGGTNMVAGIEAALTLRPKPDTVIVLTDGYTPFPDRRYEIPVVFGIFYEEGIGGVPQPPIPPWRTHDIVMIPLRSPTSVRRLRR